MPILLAWDESQFLKPKTMLIHNKINRIIETIEINLSWTLKKSWFFLTLK